MIPQLSLYEKDFYLWIQKTAQLLRDRNLAQLDFDNLIEEIESMGRSERKELKNRLITLIEHLLKRMYWQTEKEYNERGWRNMIIKQRNQIELSLADSPSLKTILADEFFNCYQKARKIIIKRYELLENMLPTEPSFTLEDTLNFDYLPE